MLNLIKMELYRLSKIKLIFVLPIILLAFALLNGLILQKMNVEAIGISESMMAYSTNEETDLGQSMIDGFKTGFEAGLSISEEEQDDSLNFDFGNLFSGGVFANADVPEMFAQYVTSIFEFLCMAMLAGVFFGADYSTSFVKNLVYTNGDRKKTYFAKAIVIGIAALAMHIVTLICVIISNAIFADKLMFNFDGAFFAYFFISLLMLISFALIVGAAVYVTGRGWVGIIVGIIDSCGVISLIAILINLFVNYIFANRLEESFDLNNYYVAGATQQLTLNADGKRVVTTIIVGLVFAALSVLLSIRAANKRDIV